MSWDYEDNGENIEVKWTIEYFEDLNKRLQKVGMPMFVIDKPNNMVYKDNIHKLLGIGVKLEG